MKTRSLLGLGGLAVVASLIWLACSGSPSTPSAAGGGVTVQGTVNSASSTASTGSPTSMAGAMGSATVAGISVSVVGASVTTTTDSVGRFVLNGVPSGSVTLHFQGQGIDATLTLTGLTDGETLTISVRLSGSKAELEPGETESPSPEPVPSPAVSAFPTCFAPSEHAEVEGNITAVGTSSITVTQESHGAFLCTVSSSTEIRHGHTKLALRDLHPGDHVHVSGTGAGASGGMCAIDAQEIMLQ
jgi:hypothetical protein